MKLTLDRRGVAHELAWTIVRPDGTIDGAIYRSRRQARAFLRALPYPKGSRVARMLVIYTVKDKP